MKLVIIDASVIIFQIVNTIEKTWGTFSVDAQIYAQNAIAFIDQNGWLPALHSRECKVIWVEDRKPYWRSNFCPDYKGHRKDKPEIFGDVYDVFAKSDVSRLAFLGYEADDIAAAIVRLWSQSDRQKIDQLFLATVDSDWMGLIIDHNIFWLGTKDYPPRFRQRAEIYTWLKGKWNKQSKKKQVKWALPDESLFKCSDIWDWKIATGDTADNVIADGAGHIVDLLTPPRMHDLTVGETADKIKWGIGSAEVINGQSWREPRDIIFALGAVPPIETLFIPETVLC